MDGFLSIYRSCGGVAWVTDKRSGGHRFESHCRHETLGSLFASIASPQPGAKGYLAGSDGICDVLV
jgi:hypothetical protein